MTSTDKVISDYVGISIPEVQELDFMEWLFYRYDSYIYNLSQHDEGRKHLENAWRMEETTPDRGKLRDVIG